MPHDTEQHDGFRENLAAYIAGGLSGDERARIEELAAADAARRNELEELMALDSSLKQSAGVAEIAAGLEARLAAAVEAIKDRPPINPIVRRAAFAAAACLMLGGFGYVASQQMERGALPFWNVQGTGDLSQRGRAIALYSNENKLPLRESTVDEVHAVLNRERGFNSYLTKQLNQAEGKEIPYDEILRYPADWPDLSERREDDRKGRAYVSDLSAVLDDQKAIDPTGDQSSKQTHWKLRTGEVGGKIMHADGHVNFEPASEITKLSGKGSNLSSNLEGDGRSGKQEESSLLKDADKEKLPKPVIVSKVRSGVAVPDGGTILFGGVALAPGDGLAPNNAPATQPAASTGRKIIRSGQVEFEIDRFDSAAATISKIVIEEGGFIATTASDKLSNGKVRGSLVVRIPPARLDVFMLQLRGLGDLKSQQIGSSDVSKEYTDLESELRAARAMEERLLEMIKSGKGEIKDLLEAEKELANWRGKIERIIGQTKYYDNLVSLATLTVTLMERDIQTPAASVEQETISAGVETDDVENARAAALQMLADAKGRIVSSDLRKLDAGQMAATIVADVPPENAGPVTDRIKQLGKVARLEAQRSTSTSGNNTATTPATRVEKRDSRLTLSLYNVANVAPKQSSHIELATADVTATYNAIVAHVNQAGGRVVNGGAAQGRGHNSQADARVEVPADAGDVFLAELKKLGQIVTLATTENADTANVTASKRGFALVIRPAATLPAAKSANLRIETGDVEQAAANLQALLLQTGGRVVSQNSSSDPGNASSASLSIEVPLDRSADVVAAIRGSGKVLAVNSSQDPNAPTGQLGKARLDVVFTTPGPIVGEHGGLWSNIRNGLSISAKGLVYSAQLIVIGLCFVLPWALILWIAAKFLKRRRQPAVMT